MTPSIMVSFCIQCTCWSLPQIPGTHLVWWEPPLQDRLISAYIKQTSTCAAAAAAVWYCQKSLYSLAKEQILKMPQGGRKSCLSCTSAKSFCKRAHRLQRAGIIGPARHVDKKICTPPQLCKTDLVQSAATSPEAWVKGTTMPHFAGTSEQLPCVSLFFFFLRGVFQPQSWVCITKGGGRRHFVVTRYLGWTVYFIWSLVDLFWFVSLSRSGGKGWSWWLGGDECIGNGAFPLAMIFNCCYLSVI